MLRGLGSCSWPCLAPQSTGQCCRINFIVIYIYISLSLSIYIIYLYLYIYIYTENVYHLNEAAMQEEQNNDRKNWPRTIPEIEQDVHPFTASINERNGYGGEQQRALCSQFTARVKSPLSQDSESRRVKGVRAPNANRTAESDTPIFKTKWEHERQGFLSGRVKVTHTQSPFHFLGPSLIPRLTYRFHLSS